MGHNYQDLIQVFNRCFSTTHNTRLIKGQDEPIYLPADETCDFHQIIFARGFYASGMHEIAHWCVAGPERRLLEDFGYWYIPDGRNLKQQQAFEKVEVKPQAIEWILCRSAGFKFRVSSDNLHEELRDRDAGPFKQAVYQQVLDYLEAGLSSRVQSLSDALCSFYQQPSLDVADFSLEQL